MGSGGGRFTERNWFRILIVFFFFFLFFFPGETAHINTACHFHLGPCYALTARYSVGIKLASVSTSFCNCDFTFFMFPSKIVNILIIFDISFKINECPAHSLGTSVNFDEDEKQLAR